jgi:hypothetical protein
MSTGHSKIAAPEVKGIPDSGKFTAEQFCQYFDVSDRTLRDWIKKYEVPHFQPGSTIIIDAEVFWQRIPLQDFTKEE